MLSLGSFRAHSCAGPTRRAFLRAGAALPWLTGLSLPQQAAAKEVKAKSVIFVWLWGAPSHLDTFDPKPQASAAYRGPFSTIATKTPGVRFTELVPRLAARSDKFSLVRSHVSYDGGHPGAGSIGMTGYREGPGTLHPSFGSIAARHRGTKALPPYVMVGRGIPRDIQKTIDGYGGGDWGKAYDPFQIRCDADGEVNVPALKLTDGISPERMSERRLLMNQLDGVRRKMDDEQFRRMDRNDQQAYTLLTSRTAMQSLDLSLERDDAREGYGYTSFGQSLLLARRLVEAEVPYVHVNWSEYVEAFTPNTDFGWDTHIHNFELLPTRHCPIFDQAFSFLLDDLQARGLLSTTLVVAMGEFGRTPKINKRAARDHWPQCFFSLWAGGGVKAGRTIGASDEKGENPITKPYDPSAVGCTMMDLLGIDSVARAELKVLPGATAISELL